MTIHCNAQKEDIEKNGMLIDGKREKVDMTAYWYNPNIHPKAEYERRKESFVKFCNMKNVKNIVCDEYDMNGFIKEVVENVGEGKKWDIRCKYCYYRRLENAFKYAHDNGYDIVSTTLTRSPYQNHEALISVANQMAKKYNVEFLYRDFRIGFREGQAKARELGLYMQKYCGCIFSEEDRYQKKIEKDKLL